MGKPQVEGHWHSLIEGFSTSSLDFYELVKAGIARREIPNLKISQVEWKQSGLGSGKRVYLRVSREDLNFDICAAPFGTGFFFSSWVTKNKGRFVVLYWLGFVVLTVVIWRLLQAMLVPSPAFSMGLIGYLIQVVLASPFVLIPLASFIVLAGVAAAARRGVYDPEAAVLAVPFVGGFYQKVFAPETYYRIDTMLMFQSTVQAALLEAIDGLTTQKGMRCLTEDERKPVFHNLM